MREKPKPQEIYKHFKGGFYQIITLAKHTETEERMVVYQALYGSYEVFVRPLSMFMEEVDRTKYPDAKAKYRFSRIMTEQTFPKAVKDEEQVVPAKSRTESENTQPEAVPAANGAARSDREKDLREPGRIGSDQQAQPKPVVVSSGQSADSETVNRTNRTWGARTDSNPGTSSNTPEDKWADARNDTESITGVTFKRTKRSVVGSAADDSQEKIMRFLDARSNLDKINCLVSLHSGINDQMIDTFAYSLDTHIPQGDLEERYQNLLAFLMTKDAYELETRRKN